jgi:hydroxyethylthiazole kinase
MPAEGEEMRPSEPIARAVLPQNAAGLLERLRARSPRVHCITNTVAQNFTANVLLAAGCVPSMTLSPEEIERFVATADALLVNLGTFDAERREATRIAIDAAREDGLPWVLDPVFIDRSPSRAAFARDLLALKPAVLRLNHAEFQILAGEAPTPDAATRFARAHGTVVALSGATDSIADAERVASIANGHPLMAKVTAMGCAGSALAAACLAVADNAFDAAAAALLMLGIAGEQAGANAAGPGSFAVAILDQLAALDAAALTAHARIDG